MKNLNYVIIAVVVVGLIGFMLWNNKVKSKEKTAALSANVPTSIPVSVAVAQQQEIRQPLSLIATVNPFNDVVVVAETQGRVLGIQGKVGDYVQQGAVLARLEDELAQATYSFAQANLDKMQKDYDRYQNLRKQEVGSDQQLDNAKLALENAKQQYITAKRRLEDARVKAPISGLLTSFPVNLGQMMNAGSVVGEILDISRLKVLVNVPEEDVFKLQLGDLVEVRSSVYPDKVFKGSVYTISSKGDASHNYPVEILVGYDARSPLKAGMFCRADFTSLPTSHALVIPRDALVGSSKNPQVYVVKNNVVHLRDVSLRTELGTSIAIDKGLATGDSVVVAGQLNLADNAVVNVVK